MPGLWIRAPLWLPLLTAALFSQPVSVSHESVSFSTEEIDGGRLALEPVVSVNTTGKLHVSGMEDDAFPDGNYWVKDSSWTHENPSTSGGIDAVVLASTEGVYFAELKGGLSPSLETARKGASWGDVVSISGNHDRPWLAEYNGDVYLLTTLDGTVQLRKTANEGQSWTVVNSDIVAVSGSAGNLTVNRTGEFYFAYYTSTSLKVQISTDQGGLPKQLRPRLLPASRLRRLTTRGTCIWLSIQRPS